ncbi:putative glyoxalase superfamily protein PhnB [Tahibacter aquaticus]|jgi:PhnB protein|uniref:Putative glyoxalase superfamily protein PhnB n=1 Tax=Tahibacter aquaticus TaxID=520092 RepID=A0A4R6YMY1_9GAMM|nr:glyoxalase superfamily protein [Tahibacter aquaticus]TDR38916.1 putative glyoxalase superfamily protein PhnB [Tahibacter aquaticus]
MSDKPASAAVIPLRFVESVDTMREFYLQQLGFDHLMGMVGKDGQLDFAIVQRAGAMLMLSRPQDAAGTLTGHMELFIEVDDVDAYHEQLSKTGLAIVQPPQTQWWGDRNFSVVDPAGHTLWFWKTVAEMQPPPGVTMI